MKSLSWLLLLVALCKLTNATTVGPLDTLTHFARRFWTTMATVARDESRSKRADVKVVKGHANSTLGDFIAVKSINDDAEVLLSKTSDHFHVTSTSPNVDEELERPTVRSRNQTIAATTLAAIRKLSQKNPLTTAEDDLKTITNTQPTESPSTTCNTTIVTSSPITIAAEDFTISQFPHAISTVERLQDRQKEKLPVSTKFSTVAPPLVNDSSTSLAVVSLIKAITTAMALVSEKLDSRLESVEVQSDVQQVQRGQSLPPIEEAQIAVKSSPSLTSGSKKRNSPKPSRVSISQSTNDQLLLNDSPITAEQVLDDLDDTLKPTNPTRPPIKNETDEPGECFFEMSDQKDMCHWNFTTKSSIKWSFGLGETAYMQGGPVRDSNGRIFGGYAFTDTSTGLAGNSVEIQRAELESPKLDKTSPSGRCFTFWYNIGGLSADRLRILLVAEDDFANLKTSNGLSLFSVLWERKDTTNNTWTKGEFLYTFSKPHRIIFEGFARSGNDHRRRFQGFIAVDDIAIDSDSCKAFCTFEGILCGWENENSDNFDWKLSRGSLSHLTGPVRDHGDGPEGGYIYVDSSYPRRPGDVSRFTSPTNPPTDGSLCFKFWTHMYGNGIGTLRIIQKSNLNEKVIWEVTGESGNSWHQAQVTIASSTPYKIILEGVIGRNFLGNIAVDDISFQPGPCPSSPQTALPSRGDCTFESDECGWINAGSGDQYDWIRTSPTQSIIPSHTHNSGYKPLEPLSDHTTGQSSGFILTMERSSAPPRAGDQAYIVGPILQGSKEGRCFSFYAYMHERAVDISGPGLGSLRVYIRVGSSPILQPIWRLVNYEHPDWFFSQTPIFTTEKFQVVISGTWGNTRQGAISIDDFTFFDRNCSVEPPEAKVNPGECTFDSNLCEWTSSTPSNKELSTWQLSTLNRRPSNLNDHTYRASSGYVFFDIFSQHPHVVRLESPELNKAIDSNVSSVLSDVSAAERCLTFWFVPFGSSNRNTFLKVIEKNVETEQETVIWDITSANMKVFRPDWTYGQVALTNNITYKIIFEGSSNNGGFAVDDLTFVPGNCESRPVSV